MSERKFLSEFSVAIGNSNVMWIPVSQISSGNKISSEQLEYINECHIYTICKSPRLSFKKEAFTYSNGYIQGDIIYKINGLEKVFSFKEEFILYDGATKVVVSDYPHHELLTLNDKDEKVRHFPANVFTISNGFHQQIEELGSLEVLYIGQSYGGDENRNVLGRLKNHSTLQKILADSQSSFPDDEISILLLKLEPYEVITQMDGRAKAEITDYRDMDRFSDILRNPLTEYQQVCLAEAGLIRYFKPRYNKIYKENFPSEKHKILEQLYALDFSALMLSIEPHRIGYSVHSEYVKSMSLHHCNIELTDPVARYGFFHWFNGDETVKIPDVI